MAVRTKYRALIDHVDKETQVKTDGTSICSSAANLWLALIGSLGVLAIVALALVFARRAITLPLRHITETMHTRATGRTISTISQVASTIAAAVEEQGAATVEIARNVQAAPLTGAA